MSLVDYDASSSSSSSSDEEGRNKDNIVISHPNHPPNAKSTRLPVKQSEKSIKRSEPSNLKLPDASLMLGSPSLTSNTSGSYDHTSPVAAAMAQNASRKRDSKEPKGAYPRGKIPRGNLPHLKNVPETAHGLLHPPQLSGRSNVVTEDINKLFTRRNGPELSASRPSSEC